MKKYRAAITSCLFWVQESRITAQLMVDGKSKEEIRKLSEDENIYNAPSLDRKRKIANTTYNRLAYLPEEIIQELSVCDYDTAKLIVLLSILLWDDLFHDFMIEVFMQKMILAEETVTGNDARVYLWEKRELYESVQKISEVSMYKLQQTYIKLLSESGLINNTKECKIIKPYVDYTFIDLLTKYNYQDFIKIITGD